MKTYIYIENNDHEGEIWKVFFRASDDEIKMLKYIVDLSSLEIEIVECSLENEMIDFIVDMKNRINEYCYYNWFNKKKLINDLQKHYENIQLQDLDHKEEFANDVLYKLGIFS